MVMSVSRLLSGPLALSPPGALSSAPRAAGHLGACVVAKDHHAWESPLLL